MPFRSESQRRKFYAMESSGEIDEDTVKEWEDKTKDKDLPESVSKAAYKLHYKTDFHGLSISIENKKGSKRHWTDPNSGDEGFTKMKYPYGYIRGTLGLDGDHVDVFLGPDKESLKVFVITQNKAPEYKDIDEQKVMLGFSSKEDAKSAYLKHYDSSKFFRDIKEMSMESFKDSLVSKKGKLIKSSNSGKIGNVNSTRFVENNMKEESVRILEQMQERMRIHKALTGAVVAGLTARSRVRNEYAANHFSAEEASVSDLGVSYTRPAYEPPIVPVRKVSPPSPEISKAEVGSECRACGYVRKSTAKDCPVCASANFGEAPPYWRR